MKTITSATEENKAITVTFSDKTSTTIPSNDLLNYIEANGLNWRKEGHGLVSDPYATEEEVRFCTDEEYLDDYFDEVVERYCKYELKLI